MTLKAFRKPSSAAPDLEQLAQAVADYAEPLTRNPILGGQLVQGLVIDGPLSVNHGLSRPWAGFIITNKTAPADITAARGAIDSLTIDLTSSAPTTIDVWVF